jgi:hypothetical protein
MNVYKRIPVTIAAGQSLSNGALAGDQVVSAIIVPSGWTAAALTFTVSDDDGKTFNSLYDDGGAEISITSAVMTAAAAMNPGRISVDPSAYAGVTLLKLRSGTSASPVNQVSAVTLYVITRKYYALK